MAIPQLQRSTEILRRLLNRVVARTDMTDVARSSQVFRLLKSFSDSLGGGYFELAKVRDTFSTGGSTGSDLDARGRDYPLTPERFTATKAGATVVLSRLTNPGSTRQIPAGCILLGPTGLTYRTTRATQVTNTSVEQISGHGVGRDYEPVPVIAEEPGADSNAIAGSIIRFASRPSGVDQVVNTTPAAGGTNDESDASYRARLENAQAALGHSQLFALEDGLRGVTVTATGARVRGVRGYEDLYHLGRAYLYIDDGDGLGSPLTPVTGEIATAPMGGAALGGEEYLQLLEWPVREASVFTLTSSGAPARGVLVRGTDYELNPESGLINFTPALTSAEVITANYTAFGGLVRECQNLVSGLRTNRLNYPGRRAAGARVQVLPPTIIDLTIYGILDLDPGAVRDTVIAAADAVGVAYVNALGPGEEFVRNELIKLTMEIDGVRDLSLVLPAVNRRVPTSSVLRTSLPLVDWD